MVVVAEVLSNGELKLAGFGVSPSNGLKRGVVVNIEATVQSIQQALREAELMADCKIAGIYTGITGSHIRGISSSGMVAIKDKEVTRSDVKRVMDTATTIILDVPISNPTTISLYSLAIIYLSFIVLFELGDSIKETPDI